MPLFAIPFPAINPVAIAVGPFAIRWYALAYIAGLLIGWRYCLRLADRPPHLVSRIAIDDFLVWATLGVVLGGRIGYVLFYNLPYYAAHPLQALYLWHGGMSFHGGAIGVMLAIWLFTRSRRIPLFAFGDIICEAIPIGLFFGRIANFINGELYGRFTDVAWAIIYPAGAVPAAAVPPQYQALCRPVALLSGPGLNCPRHPSELYEAFCEGILLFLLLFVVERRGARRHPGLVSGLFLAGYAVARMSGELFRQPDVQLGFLIFGTTMGQLLSLPLLIGGIALILWARRRPAAAPAAP
jgi:phosphatidylglycerol---prolipoprotein diacylglyceryl transferase